jgi:hypothetical protein
MIVTATEGLFMERVGSILCEFLKLFFESKKKFFTAFSPIRQTFQPGKADSETLISTSGAPTTLAP